MVEILKVTPWSELEGMVRSVPLNKPDGNGQKIFPYTNAHISLRSVVPDELNPTTFYIIEKGLAFQRKLREDLLKLGYDTLKLDCLLEIRNDEGQIWGVMPPVVEVMRERVAHRNHKGDINYDAKEIDVTVQIINDGAHRIYFARELRTPVSVVHVSGIPEEHPFYALPNSWDMVKVFTDTPKTKAEKKFYRREDCYALYRDFSVLGCGKPRNTGTGTAK